MPVVTLQEVYSKKDYERLVKALPDYNATSFPECGIGISPDSQLFQAGCHGLITLSRNGIVNSCTN